MLLDTQRKSKNRSLQLSLQEVGHEFSERLPFNLSFHVARHSFAVYALRKGVPTQELSKLMGHKSLAATEKFYAKYLPQEFISEEDRAKLEKIFTLPK
ncbi:MAG: tyrosine-type recombinase/integrase [Alistipes indistinctus]